MFFGYESKISYKKLKDVSFAADVSKEHIQKGAELIESNLKEYIAFLIKESKEHPLTERKLN